MIQTYHDRIAILLNPQAKLSPATLQLIKALWAKHTRRALDEEYRLLSLARRYSPQCLETACSLAQHHGQHDTARAVSKILAKTVVPPALPSPRNNPHSICHTNSESTIPSETMPEESQT